jgi:hypothetical protein
MSVTRRSLFAAPALFAPAVFATGTMPKRPTSAPEIWARTELYFGTNRANSEPVSEAEFASFVDIHVTERFPDGLTLLTAYGQFRNSRGELIRERSLLLILLYPRDMQDANNRIQEIRDLYKTQFSQESVLRVDSFAMVSF